MKALFLALLSAGLLASCHEQQPKKHLFILSGQSNMVALNPEKTFTPLIEDSLESNKVLIVKDAYNGELISRWYKNINMPLAINAGAEPDLYHSLIAKVYAAIDNEQVSTVTFIWMQGESDACNARGTYYKESLIGLYRQLSNDLKRADINFVIGRLSDYDLLNKKCPHWTMIRKIQVQVAENNSRFEWVNTDDLNDGISLDGQAIANDIHMSKKGYKLMGKRFAEKALQLIKKHGGKPKKD